MGLDMYLKAHKYVPNYARGNAGEQNPVADAEQLLRYNEVLDAAGMPSLKSPNDPTGFRHYGGLYVVVEVGYWRKANQVFGWLERNVCGEDEGTINCKEYIVPRDTLEELRAACLEAIREHSTEGFEPTQGFFFGSSEIDEYYWQELQQTADMCERILSNPDLADADLYYHAWW